MHVELCYYQPFSTMRFCTWRMQQPHTGDRSSHALQKLEHAIIFHVCVQCYYV